jgi:predicted RNA-binding Zn-ribbon protein involved in translation (DUF1610 family)
MAESIANICDNCEFEVIAWSDGNPYYIDEQGEKQYAYHPDHDRRARCIGNDSPHLCLSCGKEFKVDSRQPRSTCPHCQSAEIRHTFLLAGERCPACKAGTFQALPGAIS